MTTLFEISSELLALQEAIEDLDCGSDEESEELRIWFSGLLADSKAARDQKLDNYAALICELEERALVRKAEAKRLAERARVDESRAKHLKGRLQRFFAEQGIKTVETARYRLTLADNGGKLPVELEEWIGYSTIPDELCRVTKEPDIAAIRAILEAGETLEFAHLGERGQSIRIR